MKLLHIINAGVYRNPEKGEHMLTPQKWIWLYLSGCVYAKDYYPDGTVRFATDNGRAPSIGLGMPGFYNDFEFGAGRENYVIMYECDDVIYQEEKHQIVLQDQGLQFALDETVKLEAHEIEPMRELFRSIMNNYNSAIPQNILSANLTLSSLLPRFLHGMQRMDDPVERFRTGIDNDIKWEYSLNDLCKKAGYSQNYLCKEFIRRYQISPGQYRIKKRLQQIVQCFAYTNMNIKEIAYSVGMKNATHLNLLLRKHYGKSPSEMLHEYRYRSSK